MTDHGIEVSVIVPAYNAAKTLGPCLRAITEQTVRPLEVLVVDDASTDATREIAHGFGCTVVAFPDNRGVSAARNAGFAHSRGAMLMFVDADIALAPNALENALAVFDADPECGFVHGIYAAEPLQDDGPVEAYRLLHEHFWRRRACGVVGVTLFALGAVPRSVFAEVGGFDERLRDAEDVEFGSRLPDRYRVRMTETVVGRHDDDVAELRPLLAEQFRRARPLAVAVADGSHGRPLRALSRLRLVAAAALAGSAPLGLLDPVLYAVPAAAALVFAFAEPALSLFVLRRRGPFFLGFFLAVHLLVYLWLGAGIATGLVAWLAAGRPRTAGTWGGHRTVAR
jgi:glycosyltransferase involved in cell wall biosynthesis